MERSSRWGVATGDHRRSIDFLLFWFIFEILINTCLRGSVRTSLIFVSTFDLLLCWILFIMWVNVIMVYQILGTEWHENLVFL